MARYGFIVEDEEQASRRERRWRAAAKFTSWDDLDFIEQPGGREAADAVHDLQRRARDRRDRQWRDRMLTWDRAWLRSAGMSDVEARLTPEATRRLQEEVLEIVARLEAECADSSEAATVAVFIQAIPVHPEDLGR